MNSIPPRNDGGGGGGVHPFELFKERLHAIGSRIVTTTNPYSVTAQCPAHHDENPSMVVTWIPGDSRVVFFCRACGKARWWDVLRPLGLRLKDLRYPTDRNVRAPRRREVVRYPYETTEGVRIEKVRYQPKAFRWRRPDATCAGGWQWDIDGLNPLPFGIETLRGAAAVCITEGEKAALRLRALGFVVIACPHGAQTQWTDEWNAQLWALGMRGAIVFPDEDKPGAECAERIAASWLAFADARGGWAQVVKLPGLSRGADVADYLAQGHTVAQLRAVIGRTPAWFPGLTAQQKRERDRVRQAKCRARKRASRRRTDFPSSYSATVLVRRVPL
jgi:hypothetical protein